MAALKMMSLNTGNTLVLGGLLSIIRLENPDIIFLQEITVTSGQLKLFVAKYGYSAEANTDLLDITSLGTGLIWKTHLPVTDITSVVHCRVQSAKLGPYNLINIYAPSGSKNRQARRDLFGQDIFRLVSSSSSLPVLAGDFNCILSAQDTEENFNAKKCPALSDLVSGFNFSDAFRILHPNVKEFTFHRPKSAASRLDRFYLPQFLVPHLRHVSHHASLVDHHYVVAEFEFPNLEVLVPPPTSEKLYWKLNTSILQDEDFLENFQDFYRKIQSEIVSYNDIADWWDLLAKPAIREFCMGVSKRLAFVRKNTRQFLFAYLSKVIRKGNWKEVARIRKKIKSMLEKESMGFVIRSRFQENLESEKSSLFHLNRENKNFHKSSMKSLKINNQVTSDKTKIEEEILKYFGALFNGHHDRNGEDTGQPFVPDNSDLPAFLENLPKLSQPSQNSLIKNLTHDQVKFVIFKKCARNKSPGLDGLQYEFYQATWEIIGLDFVQVLQCQLDRIRLVESNRHGATRLTSKVDGIPSVWELRPITLLNCDYKILSKCFVGVLNPVLGEVITSGQLCSVEEKNILFGVSSILSSIDYVNAHNIPAYIGSFDMFKAYDRVMLIYLSKVMRAMKFPEQFINWIMMLHEGATTSFLLNFLTKPIQVLFSIRQGDPLSMILYILYIEPLLLLINKLTKGLFVSTQVQKDEDYCDDLNFLSEHESDLLVIENTFLRFEAVSGAILSRSHKSKVMGLGPWRQKQDWSLPWLQVKEELKIFGFHISASYKKTVEKCWTECYSSFNKVLMSWSSRQLETLVQRVEVLRVFATSKIWYKASALPLPMKFAKQFESAMFRFLWIGKLEKLKLDEIKNPVSSGGLNLPCVLSKADSLFLTQTCRLLAKPASKQYKHVQYWLGLYAKDHFPEMAAGPHAEIISPYFKHMKELLISEITVGGINVKQLQKVSCKSLYSGYTSTFPPPKVIYKYDIDWDRVWGNMQSAMLEPRGKEILFMIIHNIVPNRERLFSKFNMVPNHDCVQCGELHDNVHLFCACQLVREAWFWVRQRLLDLLPNTSANTSNFEFINLMFECAALENEVIWMLGIWVQLVWDFVICKKKMLKLATVQSEFSLKFVSHQNSNLPPLAHIIGL